jgi:cation diffusion facilitator family transporter
MTTLLIRFFIPKEDLSGTELRKAYGKLGSWVGILLNIVLAFFKILMGLLVKSVSITADGVNNFSDAGASIITLIGFRLAGKPADEDHPFGHARIEYISALIVSFLILFLGLQLIGTSFQKILSPEVFTFNGFAVLILVVSIFVKLWLSYFNKVLGNKINSTAMKATAADSMNDVISTIGVLISVLISHFTPFNIDGYMGILVAIFILYSGIEIIKESVNPLLGEAPSKELIQSIQKKLLAYEGVLGIHDLVVHSYGPYQTFASVHVEVASNENLLESHDKVDLIEREFKTDLGIHLVIHLDPIITDDEKTKALYQLTTEVVHSIDPALSIHDFRIIEGTTHTNLIFDVVVPTDFPLSNKALLSSIEKKVQQKDSTYYVVLTVDRNYIATPL